MRTIRIILLLLCILLSAMATRTAIVWSQQVRVMKAIVIDVGHGGADYGVKAEDKIYEKDQNLRIALALQKELYRTGFTRVVMTRSTDKEVSLKERRQVIKDSDPALVIGIHANAGFGNKAKGYEVYFPGFRTGKESRSNETSAIITDMKKNKHLNDSVRLAQQIQKHLGEVFPKENRGLREAPIPLLEGVAIPAVIIELGFLTNKDNRRKITNDKGPQDIARAVSRGVKEGM